jgi:hypothetical protein
MKDIGENECSPVLNPVHSQDYALAKIQSFRNVCPYPPYTRRHARNSNCKTDSICENDEKT